MRFSTSPRGQASFGSVPRVPKPLPVLLETELPLGAQPLIYQIQIAALLSEQKKLDHIHMFLDIGAPFLLSPAQIVNIFHHFERANVFPAPSSFTIRGVLGKYHLESSQTIFANLNLPVEIAELIYLIFYEAVWLLRVVMSLQAAPGPLEDSLAAFSLKRGQILDKMVFGLAWPIVAEKPLDVVLEALHDVEMFLLELRQSNGRQPVVYIERIENRIAAVFRNLA